MTENGPKQPDKFAAVEKIFHERMATGVEGLDHLLCGGLVRTNSLLIEGAPGSGKSTLGVQMLYRGAVDYGEPGVMIAFEEFPRQPFSEYAAYGFDLAKWERDGLLRIIWTDPRKVIAGFSGKDDLVARLIDEMGAKRVLIDSITHFRRVATSEVDLREVLYNILTNLKLKGVNSILIKEIETTDETTLAFEEYVVDASIRIMNDYNSATGEYQRGIRIRKTRGQKHIPGVHPFEFGETGIRIFPRLRPEHINLWVPESVPIPRRLATGVDDFDALIGGGFRAGTTNALVGYAGTGKSTLGRHLTKHQLGKRERVFILSFQETRREYDESCASLGLEIEGDQENFAYWHLQPDGLSLERLIIDLIEQLLAFEPTIVIIDTLSDLSAAAAGKEQLHETVRAMIYLLRRYGATSLLMNESTEMSGLIPATDMDLAFMADSVVQFSFAEVDGSVHRFLGIMKMTGTDHSKNLHQFEITSKGLVVKTKATGLSGILSGHVGGQFAGLAEEVIRPLEESRELVTGALGAPDLTADSRKFLLKVLDRLGAADILLKEHFGMTNIAGFLEEMGIDAGESDT